VGCGLTRSAGLARFEAFVLIALRETEPLVAGVFPETGAEARPEPEDCEGATGAGGASLPGPRRAAMLSAGRAGARTTTRLLPAAIDRAAGGESSPLTISVGSVTAAASAAPMSAARAMIATPLLTSSPRYADHSERGIGGNPSEPKL
jgi:hypothetical protein